jgi:hypothetical protein
MAESESGSEEASVQSDLEETESTGTETGGFAATNFQRPASATASVDTGFSFAPKAVAAQPDTAAVLARIASICQPQDTGVATEVVTDFGQRRRNPSERGGFSY